MSYRHLYCSLTIIDNKATIAHLHENLNHLVEYTVTCDSDIKKFHLYFDENYTHLIGRGETVDDPLHKLFKTYLAAQDATFVKYMGEKKDE